MGFTFSSGRFALPCSVIPKLSLNERINLWGKVCGQIYFQSQPFLFFIKNEHRVYHYFVFLPIVNVL